MFKKLKKTPKNRLITGIMILSLLVCGETVCGESISQAAVNPHQEVVNPTPISDSRMNSGRRVTYDTVFFGSYPQSEVKSSDPVYEKLQSATGWNICGDIMIEGIKYRRIKQSDAVGCTLDLESWYYDEETDSFFSEPVEPGIGADGYSHWEDYDKTYHYFRYEPIRWRVLDVDGYKGLLLSDIALDARTTDEYDWSRPTDPEDVRTIHGVVYSSIGSTWDNCVLRSWLNSYGSSRNYYKVNCSGNGEKSFYNVAFSSTEKRAILNTTLNNEGGKTAFHNSEGFEYTVGGQSTIDKVFLLSYDDVLKQYGFANSEETKDEAKTCNISDYAISLGLCGGSDDGAKPRNRWSVQWGLRTSTDGVSFNYGSDGYAAVAKDGSRFIWKNNDGSVYRYGDWVGRLQGIRPAMVINLSSTAYTYAGTVCTDGTYSDGTEYTLAGCDNGHLLDHVDALEPTYENAGHEEYWICRRCGKVFTDEEGIDETTYFNLAIMKIAQTTSTLESTATQESEETSVPVVEETTVPEETDDSQEEPAVSPEQTDTDDATDGLSASTIPSASPAISTREVSTVTPTPSPLVVPTVNPVVTAIPRRTPVSSSSGSGSGSGSSGGVSSGSSLSERLSGGSGGGSGFSGDPSGGVGGASDGAGATEIVQAMVSPAPTASAFPSATPVTTFAPVETESPVSTIVPDASPVAVPYEIPTQTTESMETMAPDVTDMATVAGVTYSVSGTSVVISRVSNRKSVTIKRKVRIGGKSYKVTGLQKKLFKGHSKVCMITIDVTFIKSIGKHAFNGIAEDAVIRLKGSRAKKCKVRKLILKSGFSECTRIV